MQSFNRASTDRLPSSPAGPPPAGAPMIDVEHVQPGRNASTRAFLDVPYSLYRSIPVWVPPIRSDARRQIDPGRNPFFRHSSAVLLLARRDGRPVGRLAVLDNANYNRFNHAAMAFFSLFECE